MQLNTNRYALTVRPARLAPKTSDVAGYFAHGNPAQLVPWTPVMSDFLNDLIDEILALLAFAKLTPSAGDTGQLLKAV